MTGLRLAIGFLTRVPVDTGPGPLVRAIPWFPVVGLLIGLFEGLVFLAAGAVLPPLPTAAVTVAAATLLTGAFHHDGLADMTDAFGGGWDVEQRLAIMKDSRLGTYGTAALILAIATEISVLAVLDGEAGLRALLAAHCLSRAVAVLTMYTAPLATGGQSGPETGPGLGAAYTADLRLGPVIAAMTVGVIAAALAFDGSRLAIPAVALALVAGAAVVALARAKIGGISGDVLGAVQQLSYLAILLVAASAT